VSLALKIIELDTNDKKQVKRFLELPFRLYADVTQWVPPINIDARRMLNRKRNTFFRHGEAAFLLALRGAQVIGRMAVLNNHNYNYFNQERTAFFYLFECEDDLEATLGLFEAAFIWAKSRGLDQIIGPKGFTVFDGLGMLVKGFEHRPAFGLTYNLPYYPALVEAAGFENFRELVSGYLDESIQFPEQVHRISEVLQKRRGLRVMRLESRNDLQVIIPKLKDLYNCSLSGTTGNMPITDYEAKNLADQLLWFADPHLIKIVMKDDQVVGFMLAYPDVSAALQRTRGRVFPFGWIYLLLELRRTKCININGAGMVEGYRGLGGTAILFSEMFKSVVESRYRYADIVQIGTDNENMQREMRGFGINFHKRHRLYKRNLI
jgi:hypothetical protein